MVLNLVLLAFSVMKYEVGISAANICVLFFFLSKGPVVGTHYSCIGWPASVCYNLAMQR